MTGKFAAAVLRAALKEVGHCPSCVLPTKKELGALEKKRGDVSLEFIFYGYDDTCQGYNADVRVNDRLFCDLHPCFKRSKKK